MRYFTKTGITIICPICHEVDWEYMLKFGFETCIICKHCGFKLTFEKEIEE